ncbi:MAG TPA: hypothetical protein PKW73_11235, partial [Candidatus Obscuribacter sp.]|nr:hypothetical protein [Candidatus Obscuribacter sp.]
VEQILKEGERSKLLSADGVKQIIEDGLTAYFAGTMKIRPLLQVVAMRANAMLREAQPDPDRITFKQGKK